MAETDEQGVELRLALAMRGGVSLAVWIGGACCEIDALRHATDPGPANFWRPWVARAGYQRVVVDVLAGASAGGLNGVLYAASQVYGFPYSAMRDTWLKLGSTKDLVRRQQPYPSLFQGDAYFQTQLTEQLRSLIDGLPAPVGDAADLPNVDLSLSVTYVEPIVRPVASPGDQELTERRFASGFVFRNPRADQAWRGTDFPPRLADDPVFLGAIARLGLAGRATSSFPGAFEAAIMRARRVDHFGAPPPTDAGVTDDNDRPIVDMGGVLLDRAGPRPRSLGDPLFVTDDGGILDNIPIGRALKAVAAAPADQRTERLVVYLQPGGSSAARPATAADPPAAATSAAAPSTTESPLERHRRELAERRNTISVLRGMARSRLGDETINADIAQLEQHNADIERAIVARRSAFAGLTSAGDLVDRADEQMPRYRLSRAMEDAHRIVRLLADPVGELDEDPFPAHLAGRPITDDQWRSPLATWTSAERAALAGALTKQLQGKTDAAAAAGDTVSLGVKPLMRVCGLLIEVARCFERALAVPADRTTASTTKAKLYRTSAAVERLLDRPRTLMWVAAALRDEPVQPGASRADAYAASALGLVDALCFFDRRDVDTIVAACRQPADGDLTGLPTTSLAAIERIVRDGPDGAPTGRVDLRTELLDRVMVELTMDLMRLPRPELPDDAAGVLAAVLPQPDASRAEVTEFLGALEVVCLPEFVHGLPGQRPIRYVRMSSENRTPLAPAFTTVLQVAEREQMWWGGAKDPVAEQGIHVDLKLAGNELANFSAFLLPEWRANDWLWGQLDAVPTLVDQLVTVDHLRDWLAGTSLDDALAEIVPDDHPWHGPPFGAEVLTAQVRRELTDIQGGAPAATAAAIRNALIARRQWQILTAELSKSWDPQVAAPQQVDVRHEVATRQFGAATMRDADGARADALRDRFREITAAAGEAIVWNVNSTRPLHLSLGPRRTRVVLWLVDRAGGLAISRLIAPAGERRAGDAGAVGTAGDAGEVGTAGELGTVGDGAAAPPTRGGERQQQRQEQRHERRVVKAAVALGIIVFAAAVALGLALRWTAFALGVACALALLVIPAWLVKRWLARLALDRLPDPSADEPVP